MHGAVPQAPGRPIIILEPNKVTDHAGLEDLHQLVHILGPILPILVDRLSIHHTLTESLRLVYFAKSLRHGAFQGPAVFWS